MSIFREEQDCVFDLCSVLVNAALWYSKHAAYVAAIVEEYVETNL